MTAAEEIAAEHLAWRRGTGWELADCWQETAWVYMLSGLAKPPPVNSWDELTEQLADCWRWLTWRPL